MSEQNIFTVFEDRVRRRVGEGLRQYRDELQGLSNEMASRGLRNSGPHLRRRVEVLRKWTVTVTDQAFEAVTRLPGNQSIHREMLGDFLEEQLRSFLSQGEGDVICFDAPDSAKAEIRRQIAEVREGLDSDLQEFQAGMWRPRQHTHAASFTQNTVNIHGSNVGAVQQAGHGSAQSAVVRFNVEAARSALEDLAAALPDADIPADIKDAAMIEIDTIRPQLRKAAPNVSIVYEGLHTLRNILEGVAAGLLANKLTALLIAAGVTLAS